MVAPSATHFRLASTRSTPEGRVRSRSETHAAAAWQRRTLGRRRPFAHQRLHQRIEALRLLESESEQQLKPKPSVRTSTVAAGASHCGSRALAKLPREKSS